MINRAVALVAVCAVSLVPVSQGTREGSGMIGNQTEIQDPQNINNGNKWGVFIENKERMATKVSFVKQKFVFTFATALKILRLAQEIIEGVIDNTSEYFNTLRSTIVYKEQKPRFDMLAWSHMVATCTANMGEFPDRCTNVSYLVMGKQLIRAIEVEKARMERKQEYVFGKVQTYLESFFIVVDEEDRDSFINNDTPWLTPETVKMASGDEQVYDCDNTLELQSESQQLVTASGGIIDSWGRVQDKFEVLEMLMINNLEVNPSMAVIDRVSDLTDRALKCIIERMANMVIVKEGRSLELVSSKVQEWIQDSGTSKSWTWENGDHIGSRDLIRESRIELFGTEKTRGFLICLPYVDSEDIIGVYEITTMPVLYLDNNWALSIEVFSGVFQGLVYVIQGAFYFSEKPLRSRIESGEQVLEQDGQELVGLNEVGTLCLTSIWKGEDPNCNRAISFIGNEKLDVSEMVGQDWVISAKNCTEIEVKCSDEVTKIQTCGITRNSFEPTCAMLQIENGPDVVCNSCGLDQMDQTPIAIASLGEMLLGEISDVVKVWGDHSGKVSFEPDPTKMEIPGYSKVVEKIEKHLPVVRLIRKASWFWKNRKTIVLFVMGPLMVMMTGILVLVIKYVRKRQVTSRELGDGVDFSLNDVIQRNY